MAETITLPERTLVITRAMIARYAEAAGDDNPIHLDEAAARRFGFAGVIAHGMLAMGIMGRLLQEALPTAQFEAFSARFRAAVEPDRPLRWTAVGERLEAARWQWTLTLSDAERGTTLVVGRATLRQA